MRQVIALAFGVSMLLSQEADAAFSWVHRKPITIDRTKVTGSLTNFPVLVDITDADLASKALDTGTDIIFTDAADMQLDHEIESYTSSTGHLVAWVKVPSLSSTADTQLYMYYGNSGSTWHQSQTGVWDSNYKLVDHLREAHIWPGDPVLQPDSSFNAKAYSSVLKDGSTYYMYYSKRRHNEVKFEIYRATSSDGKTWTEGASPVLGVVANSTWESAMVYIPCVWKEGSTWYMIYTGRGGNGSIGSLESIGLATSANGVTWVRSSANPILRGSGGGWEGNTVENFGVIKVPGTPPVYYLEYESADNATSDRSIGIATSTDLVTWTKNPNNPIWTGNYYCGSWFKYGDYFYHLVSHGTTIELYRDVNPTFYASSRELVGAVISTSMAGTAVDTPWVLTNDIFKNSFPNNQLWFYYSLQDVAGVPAGWTTNLTVIPDLDSAVSVPPSENNPLHRIFDSTVIRNSGIAISAPASTPGKIGTGQKWFKNAGQSASNDAFNIGAGSSLDFSRFTIEAWVKLPNASSPGPSQNGWMTVLEKGNTDANRYGLWTKYGQPAVIINGNILYAAAPHVLSNDTWTHIVASHDGSTSRLYFNGSLSNSTTSLTLSSANTAGDDLLLGQSSVSGYVGWWEGSMDEVRISSTARTSQWIATEYANQSNPATFYTLGLEQTL